MGNIENIRLPRSYLEAAQVVTQKQPLEPADSLAQLVKENRHDDFQEAFAQATQDAELPRNSLISLLNLCYEASFVCDEIKLALACKILSSAQCAPEQDEFAFIQTHLGKISQDAALMQLLADAGYKALPAGKTVSPALSYAAIAKAHIDLAASVICLAPTPASTAPPIANANPLSTKKTTTQHSTASEIPSKIEAEWIDSSTIRFSQSTVSATKIRRTATYSLAAIEASMRTKGFDKKCCIDVVRMPDGNLTSMDNTRLLAAKRTKVPVYASVHEFNERIPQQQCLQRYFFDATTGLPSATWGEAMHARLGQQNWANCSRGKFTVPQQKKALLFGTKAHPQVTGG
ncbi:MAG: hypothetical protein V4623_00100 [Pseudomonadota bacterium]